MPLVEIGAMKLRLLVALTLALVLLAAGAARADPTYATNSYGGCFSSQQIECTWSANASTSGSAVLEAALRSPGETLPGSGFGVSIVEFEAAAEHTGEPARDVPLDVTIHVEKAEVVHSGALHTLLGPAGDSDLPSGVEIGAAVDVAGCQSCAVVQYCAPSEGCDLEGLDAPVVRLAGAPSAIEDTDVTFHLALYNNNEPFPAGPFTLRIALVAFVQLSRGGLPDNGTVRASFDGAITSVSIG